jgi:hypothetical protein
MMEGLVIVGQAVLIIWLLIQLGVNTHNLNHRIDRASRHLERTKEPEDPKPICGCSHHQCFHDESGCKSARRYDGETLVCGCLRYAGPEVLPTVLP